MRQFLENTGKSIFNTKPDAQGNYEFDVTDLVNYSEIKIIFSDSQITRYDRVACQGNKSLKFMPQGLQSVSKKDKVFYYDRRIASLKQGESQVFQNESTTEITVINSRSQIIKMSKFLEKYSNLSEKQIRDDDGPFTLDDLQKKRLHTILTTWHKLDFKAKLKLYNQLYTQEVNIFLKIRDIEFFESVARRSLMSKIQKSVVDHCLLGNTDEIISATELGGIGMLTPLELVIVVFALTSSNQSTEVSKQKKIQQSLQRLRQECENRKLVFEMSEFDERSN